MVFPSTHWSQLALASLNGNTAGRHALEELCNRYWSPVHQFIRSRGRTESEAEDLTQEFLLFLLKHSTFKRADRLRGRFRTLLLHILVWFLSDARDKQQAAKRGGRHPPESLDSEECDVDAALAVPPADAADFDRAWAMAVLKSAWNNVRREYADERASSFAVLRRFLPGAVEPPTYEEAAAMLGISVNALSSEIFRLRGRFRGHVRAEVARTVSAPHEIDEEMAHLRHLLEDRGTDFCTLAESQPAEILRRG